MIRLSAHRADSTWIITASTGREAAAIHRLSRLLLKLLMITAIIVSSIAMNRVSKQETVNALICVSLSTLETYS